MKNILLACSLIVVLGVCVQSSSYQSYSFSIEKQGEITLSKVEHDWNTYVYSVESPFPGSNSARNYLHQLKLLQEETNSTLKSGSQVQKTNNLEPTIVNTFAGNPFGGIPNDNDLAISNAGIIMSVTNSIVYVFDETGVELQDVSLNVFADSLNLPANSYDPKVAYDPKQDKFILVFLNGSDSDNTAIAVCFSKTNNPLDGWNMYALDGNPLDNNAWSDFPAIAMTDEDFYITVNHINSDSVSWQTGFMQSIVWHIEKESGYSGETLNASLYTDIFFEGKPIRNLTPMKGGMTTYGPDMYLVSNRNFDAVNDTFFLVHINDKLANAANINVTTDYFLADNSYRVPPHVHQPQANIFLQTNDARPLGGFYENGTIHFVGNTASPTTGLGAIYHTKVNVNNFDNTALLTIIEGTDSLEYGYPNISFSGLEACDEQAIINFNHSSVDSFPGMSAIFYQVDSGYSERVHIKNGESYVNLISGNFERWGDYSGSQRRYNNPGEVWFNGFYGFKAAIAIGGTQQRHNTWIAGLNSVYSKDCDVAIRQPSNPLQHTSVYPNPLRELLFFKFTNPEEQYLSFEIIDINGKVVKQLLYDQIKKGENVLTFSTNPLSNGLYFLLIKSNEGSILSEEKIIKQ
ncbi:MAG: T9SS type A sorting domain-containing protein [Chitinophagales bacterium]